MKMQIFGDSKTGFFISSEDDGDTASRPHLESCPFCGGSDRLRICNTHTPSFWVECECGASMHGGGVASTKKDFRTRTGAMRVFTSAMHSAVACWNTRPRAPQAL